VEPSVEPELSRELSTARALAREAGRILLEVYATDFAVVEKANEGGPVTEADRRANAYLVDELRRAFPGDGIVAEESADHGDARTRRRCWFVDPLDGTAEFVARNGEFAVHVGLAVDGEARLGVVYRPVGDKLYAGIVGGACTLEEKGAIRPLGMRTGTDPAAMTLVVSRSHRSRKTDAIRRSLGISRVIECGSVGLKCGLLAEGVADVYLHPGGKSQRWDSCAPEAVLRAAGGILTDLAGEPYRYDGDELGNVRGLLGCSALAFPTIRAVTATVARPPPTRW
jgi:3'(2'), 5'-bisphosphate nucleotidase